jgi:predicted acylesterase/phospholipase RssA
MDATYWIIGAAVVFAASAVLSLAWVLVGSLFRRRRPGLPRSFRQGVVALPALCGLVLLVGAVIAAPWSDQSRWTNELALEAPSHVTASASNKPSPLISDLARQVGDDGTLVAITISGGGSRAAYFAAAVLERLSKVKWPGPNGDSLIEHVNLVSSVSGGSLAAAYFALNGPGRSNPGPQALANFFERFKQAMATNLELSALGDLLDPRNTLPMLTLNRPMAESVADAMDDVLTGGKGTTLGELQRRAAEGNGPILLLNATRLDNSNPFVFAVDDRTRPIFTFTLTPETSRLPKLSRSVDRPRSIAFFDDTYGELGQYRIADAAAASAAYPVMLGSIALGTRDGDTVRLGDGGLVDNLGLLTLYSLLLDPDLYKLTQGKLRRIIVLTIDSETQSIHPGLLSGLEGLSTWSEEALHRFVIPAMIQSAYQRELGDVLEDDAWKDFSPPSPIFISYGECSRGRDVATRFRLSEADRKTVQETAEVCVLDAGTKKLEALLAAAPQRPGPLYAGRFTSADLNAVMALLEIADKEQTWWRWKHTTVEIGRLTTEKPMWSPRPTPDGMRLAPQPIDALDHEKLDRTQYDYKVDVQPGGGAIVRATPRVYRQLGRVSFYVELDPAILDDDDICDAVQANIRGADSKGAPTGPDAQLFAVQPVSCVNW